MKIYDVSMTIEENMQVYKDIEAKKPVIEVYTSDPVYESILKDESTHGTHMDFDLHMIPNGKTSDTLDLNRLITQVKVFDLTHLKYEIDAKDLDKLEIKHNDFVLFKTRNSYEDFFNFEFIFINESAAKYLADKKISGVGVDGLGVERDQKGHPTHKALMAKDIIIIEGLRLKEIKEDSYMMYALPIKIKHVDALPLSVILVKE